jgi:hypothetical protein
MGFDTLLDCRSSPEAVPFPWRKRCETASRAKTGVVNRSKPYIKSSLSRALDMITRRRHRDLPNPDLVQILAERVEEVLSDPDTFAGEPKRLDFVVQGNAIRKTTRLPGRVEIELQTSEIRLTAFY